MFDAGHLIDLLIMGWLSNVPLAIGSVWTLSIFGERWWKLRGLEDASRVLASTVIERLAARDAEYAVEVFDGHVLPTQSFEEHGRDREVRLLAHSLRTLGIACR